MSNFELIDDYLTNRLTESERVAFEQQVASDPSLKADVELQKNILQGIKNARAAELKAMLNNIPVSSPVSMPFTGLKIAAGVIGAGILITSLYYYFQPEALKEAPNLSTSIQDSVQGHDSVESTEKLIPPAESVEEKLDPVVATPDVKTATESKKEDKPVSSVSKPKIDVVDPSEDISSEKESDVNAEISKSSVAASHIQVETDSSSKKYNFHYQFNNGKLQLFGPFDKSLYEILEIHGEGHAVFMFYRENYYLLDENQTNVTRLAPIKDSALIKKLREFRGR